MFEFNELTAYKVQLVEALTTLPEKTLLPRDLNSSQLIHVNLRENVNEDIERLESFWKFAEEFQSQKVIALIGMVNTGKSALGNHLLNQGESGIFEEAPIRQTSKSEEARIDENTIIIDLPGLGSVLADEDDKIVKNVIRRANLLLLVLDINYPIPKHLYDFLQSEEVLKTYHAQPIVIVINKIDCLADLPHHLQEKKIQSYINFLLYGNEKMNFKGIAHLFDYEIPIIPYSVRQARKKPDAESQSYLHQTITERLENSVNNTVYRSVTELTEIAYKYLYLLSGYLLLREKEQILGKSVSSVISKMADELDKVINSELRSFWQNVANVRDSCDRDMQNYITTSDERFWRGENYQRKKAGIEDCRDRYQDLMKHEFKKFTKNLQESFEVITSSILGQSLPMKLPKKKEIISHLKESIWEMWNGFDDYWFLDKDEDSFEESMNESKNSIETASELISTWVSDFVKSFFDSLNEEKEDLPLFAEVSQYKNTADGLENFWEKFTSIELVEKLIQSTCSQN